MTKTKAVVVAALWLGSGVLGAGWYNGASRAEFTFLRQDEHETRRWCALGAVGVLLGPATLISGFLVSGGGYDPPSYECGAIINTESTNSAALRKDDR